MDLGTDCCLDGAVPDIELLLLVKQVVQLGTAPAQQGKVRPMASKKQSAPLPIDPLHALRNASVESISPFQVLAPVEAKPSKETVAVCSSPEPEVTLVLEVARAITISWGAQMIRLSEGDRPSEEAYGAGCIDKFRDAGVQFRKV